MIDDPNPNVLTFLLCPPKTQSLLISSIHTKFRTTYFHLSFFRSHFPQECKEFDPICNQSK